MAHILDLTEEKSSWTKRCVYSTKGLLCLGYKCCRQLRWLLICRRRSVIKQSISDQPGQSRIKMRSPVLSWSLLCLAAVSLSSVAGHIALRFPPPREYDLDFVDDLRYVRVTKLSLMSQKRSQVGQNQSHFSGKISPTWATSFRTALKILY